MLVDSVPRPAGAFDALYRISAMARHNTIIRLRDPGQAISYVVMPMVLMLVLKPLYVRAVDGGATQVSTGLMVMFSVFAISLAGNAILSERTWRTWDRLRVSRAAAAELLVGKILPIFAIMVVQQVLLLTYGCLVIGLPVPSAPHYVLAAILIWAFALLALGALLAAIVRSHGELSVICDVGALTLSSLGGALVPLSLMPEWAQLVAPASPGYWALNLMQAAVRGDLAGMLPSAAILLAIGLAAGAFAARRLARGWGRGGLI
ncbi:MULTISPECIES: ABC transporter permease [Nonomuraea]|uniref:Transport permease protein n=1 Tax=Nonomuraea ferruginea TaxID=46174 RepID=A0ABT4TAW9_9ACTN|nr:MULTISPECIES: ABC transporter permease [Nonomuraea]MDA0646600.1 ABC transporter permease [Nonomuraea ferruginea]TXK39243.1 ABC transporter permease [Nonomuraea sp. C10]